MTLNSLLSYYDILGVAPHASDEDIQNAYKVLAKKYHPDKNPRMKRMAELRFKAISEAYHTLNSRERRQLYNLQLSKQKNGSGKRTTKRLIKTQRPTNDNTGSRWFDVLLSILKMNKD